MKPPLKLASFALPLFAVGTSAAADWDLTGFVGANSRVFGQTARYAPQHAGTNVSLAAQSEFYWQGEGGRVQFGAIAFARIDADDRDRTHADLREASLGIVGDAWDLSVGVGKVFWGVTESRHLIDVINQSDLLEDLDEEDKLGQPLVNLNLDRDFGRLELFVLPRFRERAYPGPGGRLRFALPVASDEASFESPDGRRHTDAALRYSNYFGELDLGAYVFDGTSREPRFALAPEGDRLVPIYEQMTQLGTELQLTRGPWLWKLEAIRRKATSDTFTAVVAGFEHTAFGVRGSQADVGVLLEYLYDGRVAAAPPTPFDHDVFIGMRLALNDTADTSLLAGVVVDVDTEEALASIELERRIAEHLTLELRLRAFMNAAVAGPLDALRNDDHLEVAFSRYY